MDDLTHFSKRYFLLMVPAFAQAITVFYTWPLWQPRTDPPLLPVLDVPQFSFGIIMIATLVMVAYSPRFGVVIHWGVMLLSFCFDQTRTQPQVIANAVLMLAVAEDWGPIAARWFLASLWCWAGFHKLISPDWYGDTTRHFVAALYHDPDTWQLPFCYAVALGEMTVGILAIIRPRLAAIPCVLLHVGICIFLSPLFLNHNASVIPWNLATAIVGYWVMMNAPDSFRQIFTEWLIVPALILWISWHFFWACLKKILPKNWEPFAAAALMLYPAGFYLGWIDHGVSHVLYSENYPRGYITTQGEDGDTNAEQITGWGDLHVPFPNERRLLVQSFQLSAEPGALLHVFDPRPTLPDLYYQLNEQRQLRELSESDFHRLGGKLFPNSRKTAMQDFTFHCSDCRKAEEISDYDESAAEVSMEAKGWYVSDEKDLCPACQPAPVSAKGND